MLWGLASKTIFLQIYTLKMKKDILHIGLIAILIFAFFFAIKQGQRADKREIDRLRVELAKAQHYTPMKKDTIRDSVVVYSQDIEMISKAAYKRELADKKLIKDLKMKISRMESEQTLDVVTHDTVYLRPSADSLSLEYKDKWVQFAYDVPTQRLNYSVKDSIQTFVEKIPKHRFLWWRWGVKGYKVKVVNYNPHSTIIHNDYYHLAK